MCRHKAIEIVFLIEGYGTMKDTVLVWRFHGAMYDGVTIAKVIVYTLTNPKLITFKAFNQYYHHHNHVIRVSVQLVEGLLSAFGFCGAPLSTTDRGAPQNPSASNGPLTSV